MKLRYTPAAIADLEEIKSGVAEYVAHPLTQRQISWLASLQPVRC